MVGTRKCGVKGDWVPVWESIGQNSTQARYDVTEVDAGQ